VNITLNDGTTIATTTKKSTDSGVYEPGDNSAYFLEDTGEIIIGKNVYAQLSAAKANDEGNTFSITYTKNGFEKGELDPTQYFDCIDKTDENSDNWITYTNRNQEIMYEINFNQTIKINTQGKDVFTQDMTRDLDDIIDAVNYALDVENKKSKIENLYNNSAEGSTEQSKYKEILDLCDRELDMAKDNMTKAFTNGMDNFTTHQNTVSLARTDVGAKLKRVELNESRLEAQKTTVQNLKSVNEEVNVASVAIELSEAESIYDASLAAASKVIQKKLLDFL
jgi:flagellar hook-associated protein 3 FlgL